MSIIYELHKGIYVILKMEQIQTFNFQSTHRPHLGQVHVSHSIGFSFFLSFFLQLFFQI